MPVKKSVDRIGGKIGIAVARGEEFCVLIDDHHMIIHSSSSSSFFFS